MRYLIWVSSFILIMYFVVKCSTPKPMLDAGGVSNVSDKIVIKRNSGDVIFIVIENDCTRIQKISKDTLLIKFKVD